MYRGSYCLLLAADSSSQVGRQFSTPSEKYKPRKRAYITKVACNAWREKKSAVSSRPHYHYVEFGMIASQISRDFAAC